MEAVFLTRKWETILGVGTLTYLEYIIFLMGDQKVAPMAGWDEVESQLEAWAVFCTLFLGDDGVHPATYYIFLLMEETSRVSLRLWEQARQKTTSPLP